MMEKLKSCECGAEPKLESWMGYCNSGYGKSYIGYRVFCEKCGKKTKPLFDIDVFDAGNKVIEAWNTRAIE